MTKSLRKRHLVTWSLLALLLPAGIFVGWLSVPKQLQQTLLQPGAATPFPVIIKTIQKENYTVTLRGDTAGTNLQLEWINKSALQYPTATIFAGNEIKNFKEAKLIGRIEARGSWYFSLDSTFRIGSPTTNHFTIYDFIHQQVIDTINFEP